MNRDTSPTPTQITLGVLPLGLALILLNTGIYSYYERFKALAEHKESQDNGIPPPASSASRIRWYSSSLAVACSQPSQSPPADGCARW